jgi:hypothetical protein
MPSLERSRKPLLPCHSSPWTSFALDFEGAETRRLKEADGCLPEERHEHHPGQKPSDVSRKSHASFTYRGKSYVRNLRHEPKTEHDYCGYTRDYGDNSQEEQYSHCEPPADVRQRILEYAFECYLPRSTTWPIIQNGDRRRLQKDCRSWPTHWRHWRAMQSAEIRSHTRLQSTTGKTIWASCIRDITWTCFTSVGLQLTAGIR